MQNQPPPWPPQQPPGQPPSFYTQPTQMYPGQFGPPPSPPQEPQRRRTFRQWFGAQTRFAKVGLGCGSLVLVGLLCLCSMAAYGSTLPQSKSAPPPTRSVANNNASQTATLLLLSHPLPLLRPPQRQHPRRDQRHSL